MLEMDKISSPYIEQYERLNRSAKASNLDKSLFYLYLSMLEQNIENVPRYADSGSTNEIVYADIESHYYKHPSLQFSAQDFIRQEDFTIAVNAESVPTLRLLNAFFPQGLSQYNNHLRINPEVIEGLDIYAKQRVTQATQLDSDSHAPENLIEIDATMLFDLIPKASEFLL
jgi:hypothetical protein